MYKSNDWIYQHNPETSFRDSKLLNSGMNVKKCKVVSHACEHAEFLSVQGLEPNPTQKISSLLARFLHSLLGRLGRLGLGRCTRFGLTALQSDISGRLILVLGVVLLCIPAMGHGRKYYHSLSIYASVVSWSQHILIYIYGFEISRCLYSTLALALVVHVGPQQYTGAKSPE